MIVNDSETKIVSNQGGRNKSSFCLMDVHTKVVSNFNLENAKYVHLRKIANNHFLCFHHFNGEKLILTIHSFENPKLSLGRIEIKNNVVKFDGDLKVWEYAPHFIVEWLKVGSIDDYYLIEIKPKIKRVILDPITWFHSDEFDRGYQGLYDVVEIPNTNFLLFPIQRSSSPVLYDFLKKVVIGRIKLAGRAGNPSFKFRKQQSELWAVDYDTLVRLEVGSWKILQSKRLQNPILGTTMTFVGDFAFTSNEKYCSLARPYSNDVLLLDVNNMRQVGKIKSKYQPMQVAVLNNLECVYQDWKTGKFDFKNFKNK